MTLFSTLRLNPFSLEWQHCNALVGLTQHHHSRKVSLPHAVAHQFQFSLHYRSWTNCLSNLDPKWGRRLRLPRIISLATVPPAVARLSHGASQGWEETRVFGGVNTDVQILWYLVFGELVLGNWCCAQCYTLNDHLRSRGVEEGRLSQVIS